WATPGSKTVRLQIEEFGCTSDLITQNVSVVAQLTPPVVICSPNTSGMTFTWTVDGAAPDHEVNILTGQSGTQNGNSLEFTGLNPGDIVELEIITYSAGPCPERRDTFMCTAQDCPDPIVTVSPVMDICLYAGTQPVDLEVTIVDGNGGT